MNKRDALFAKVQKLRRKYLFWNKILFVNFIIGLISMVVAFVLVFAKKKDLSLFFWAIVAFSTIIYFLFNSVLEKNYFIKVLKLVLHTCDSNIRFGTAKVSRFKKYYLEVAFNGIFKAEATFSTDKSDIALASSYFSVDESSYETYDYIMFIFNIESKVQPTIIIFDPSKIEENRVFKDVQKNRRDLTPVSVRDFAPYLEKRLVILTAQMLLLSGNNFLFERLSNFLFELQRPSFVVVYPSFVFCGIEKETNFFNYKIQTPIDKDFEQMCITSCWKLKVLEEQFYENVNKFIVQVQRA